MCFDRILDPVLHSQRFWRCMSICVDSCRFSVVVPLGDEAVEAGATRREIRPMVDRTIEHGEGRRRETVAHPRERLAVAMADEIHREIMQGWVVPDDHERHDTILH